MVKVRIQLRSEGGGSTSPFSVAKEVFAEGGVKGFYKGLDSAIIRQVVYGTLRLGIYFNLTEKWKRESGQNTTTRQKFAASIIAGGFGSFCGNPADLALVRLQADSSLPVAERRNYKGALDAFSRIIAEEGVPSLWKGAVPTMTRAISLNCAQLVSYETVKESLTASLKGSSALTIQIYASLVSSVFTAFFSLPFDNVKTKMQKQKANA